MQRFAAEITGALDRMAAEGACPPARLLAPPGATSRPFRNLAVERFGRLRGQAWEQTELPLRARGSMLVSLGNTAPLLACRRQAVVIHDAGVFDTPEILLRRVPRLVPRAAPRPAALRRAAAHRIGVLARPDRGSASRLDPGRIGVVPEGGEHILRVPADTAVLERHGLLAPGASRWWSARAPRTRTWTRWRRWRRCSPARGMRLAVAGAADPGVFRNAGDPDGAAVAALGRVTRRRAAGAVRGRALPRLPVALRGLRPAAAGGDGVRLPGARRRVRRGAGGLRRRGAVVRSADSGGPRRPADALERLLREQGLAEELRRRGLERARPLLLARGGGAAAGAAARAFGSGRAMKVAIVHEWLDSYAGSERVVEQLLAIWPEADLFAVCDFLPPEERGFLGGRPVRTTFIQRLPFARRHFR